MNTTGLVLKPLRKRKKIRTKHSLSRFCPPFRHMKSVLLVNEEILLRKMVYYIFVAKTLSKSSRFISPRETNLFILSKYSWHYLCKFWNGMFWCGLWNNRSCQFFTELRWLSWYLVLLPLRLLFNKRIWIYFDWSSKSIPSCSCYYNDFHSRHKDLMVISLIEDLLCSQIELEYCKDVGLFKGLNVCTSATDIGFD